MLITAYVVDGTQIHELELAGSLAWLWLQRNGLYFTLGRLLVTIGGRGVR
jgi:hypothetical protein